MSLLRVSSAGGPRQDTVQIHACIPARKITVVLFLIASVLLVLHLSAFYVFYYSPIDSSLFRLMVEALDLNNESTLSTWYASVTLLICAVGFALVALGAYPARSSYVLHWAALSLIAVFFSADEIAGLHEKLNGPVRMLLHTDGVFTFAWVIPGLIFVVFLLVSFRRFYRSLPPRTRFYLGLAAALYFGGSIGFEMVGGEYSDSYGREAFGYKVLTGLEEFLEMAGVATLIHGIALYINGHVSWSVQGQKPGEASASGVSGIPTLSRSIAAKAKVVE